MALAIVARVVSDILPARTDSAGGGLEINEKSSTARPSSDPDALRSFQRMKKVAPVGMFNPPIAELIAVRFGATFPLSAPVLPVVTGAVKSSPSTSVHAPSAKPVALRLY